MTIELTVKLESDELREAIARFEQMHGKVQDTIPKFVLALINYSHEILSVPEAFIGEDDESAKILELIGEDSIPPYLRDEYDDVCDRLHEIEDDDEIWKLIEAIVRAVVSQQLQLLAGGIIKAY